MRASTPPLYHKRFDAPTGQSTLQLPTLSMFSMPPMNPQDPPPLERPGSTSPGAPPQMSRLPMSSYGPQFANPYHHRMLSAVDSASNSMQGTPSSGPVARSEVLQQPRSGMDRPYSAYTSTTPSNSQGIDIEAACASWASRLDQEAQAITRLDQEEAMLASEELQLRRELDDVMQQRRMFDDKLFSLNHMWGEMVEREQWYYDTPELDLSHDINQAEFQCGALRHKLEQLTQELEGCTIHARRYVHVEQEKAELIKDYEKLVEGVAKIQSRKRAALSAAEMMFDVEARREKVAQRAARELQDKIQELTARVGLPSVAMSQPTSRAASVAVPPPTVPLPAPPMGKSTYNNSMASSGPVRPRLVSFTGANTVNTRPQANSVTGKAPGLPSTYEADPERSFVFDFNKQHPLAGTADAEDAGGSVCFGLDDDSVAFGGGSVAMSLCNTKKHRTEGIA